MLSRDGDSSSSSRKGRTLGRMAGGNAGPAADDIVASVAIRLRQLIVKELLLLLLLLRGLLLRLGGGIALRRQGIRRH